MNNLLNKTVRKAIALLLILMVSGIGNVFADVMYFVHTDHLGTPVVITDGTQKKVWQGNKQPFGKTDISVNLIEFNSRFPGQFADTESGLHYNYFRDYDPALGRYVQSDPIGLVGGMNTYTYVLNNPLMRVDPLGLSDLTYNNNTGTLTITDGNGNVVGNYPAANNAQSGSRGPWQQGTYNYDYHTTHADDAPNSAYGSSGNFVFNVPGCVGCGVHSGRANSTDRAGRSGPGYATNGCVRTTDDATSEIQRLIQNGDPLQTLTVIR